MDHNRPRTFARRGPALVTLFSCLPLAAFACSQAPEAEPYGSSGGAGAPSAGSGGASSSGSGGVPSSGSGGVASAGASGSGGSTSGSSGSGGSAFAGTGGSAGADNPGAVKSAGCGQMSTLTFASVPGEDPNAAPGSGNTEGFGEGGYVEIQSGGETRGFAVRLPDGYDKDKPYPVIFGFHWNGGSSAQVDNGGSNGYEMAHFGLQKLSDNGAIFIAPNGIGAGWANSDGRDLTFVDDIVELISNNYCVDESRLFANGFSYGGGMSYAIACARATVFRGVAIYNGAQLSGCEDGSDPIAYWQMAGLTDNVCTVDAGKPMRDKFVENNGCTPQDPPQPPQPEPYLSEGGHVCTDYEGCSSGHPVRWCVHQSGHGNAIVDGTGDLYHTCATPPNECSDSCRCSWVPGDVWSFFSSL
jgi:poly(3-hydroxybutyrate) depolymerase